MVIFKKFKILCFRYRYWIFARKTVSFGRLETPWRTITMTTSERCRIGGATRWSPTGRIISWWTLASSVDRRNLMNAKRFTLTQWRKSLVASISTTSMHRRVTSQATVAVGFGGSSDRGRMRLPHLPHSVRASFLCFSLSVWIRFNVHKQCSRLCLLRRYWG